MQCSVAGAAAGGITQMHYAVQHENVTRSRVFV
jgi:hypothetical protein